MDLQAEKLYLIQQLINIHDHNSLERVRSLLLKSKKNDSQPMTLEAFYAKIDASEQAYQKGEIISHNDLKKEVKSWHKER